MRVLANRAVRFLIKSLAVVLLGQALPGQVMLASAGSLKNDIRKIQYVVISFDGAKNIGIWKETRALARKYQATFTYFVSCVYFLHRGNARLYRAPGHRAGRSAIGFAKSAEDVGERLDQLNLAMRQGHEIASHACGHFNGARWSRAAWQSEFSSFTSILKNAYTNNGLSGEPKGWKDLIENTITGFRAPFMARNAALDQVLAKRGFSYDASRGGYWDALPGKSKYNVWDFRLAFIPEGPKQRLLLAMDYNLYVRHSSARPRPALARRYQARAFKAYMRYFQKSYTGNRTPVQIGHHFARWNGNAYGNALERFVATVCPLKDVKCVSYAQLAKALELK